MKNFILFAEGFGVGVALMLILSFFRHR